MNTLITRIMLIPAFLLVIQLHASAATPQETVETGVDKVLKTLGDPAFKAKPRDVKIEEVGNIIGEVMDWNIPDSMITEF